MHFCAYFSSISLLTFTFDPISYYIWIFDFMTLQKNLDHKSNKALTNNIFHEDIASLENICTLMGLYGCYILNYGNSVSGENTGSLLQSYLNPVFDCSLLPSDKILIDMVMKKLENNSSDDCIHFEIEAGDAGSEPSQIHAFIPQSDKLPGIVALFFNAEGAFTSGQMKGLEFAYNLICDSVQQKRAIKELEREKTKYRHLFLAGHEAIVMLDKNNCIEEANPSFLNLFQYSKSQLIGKEVDALLAPGALNEEAVLLSHSNWRGSQVSVETKRQRRDGTFCDVLVMGVPFYHEDGQLRVFAIYRDISERVKAEKQKQQRLEFIEYISGLSSTLINANIKSIDTLIAEVLQKLGQSYFAERAYLVMLNEDGSRLEFSYEWTEDERFSHRNTLAYLAVDEITDYINCLKSGIIFNLSRNEVGKVKGTDNLELFFDLQNIESLLHIPLFSDQNFIGFIGFDTYSCPIHWESQIVNSLRLTGQILVNALSRKQTELDLTKALLQAKSSDNLKSAFLAGISHEIRTPMNHILGFIDLLTEDDIEESEKSEFVAIMKKSGMDLLHLIDDVIELALIDSGQVELRQEPCSLKRLMESLMTEAEGLKISMQRTNIQIRLNMDKILSNQIILTDEYRLRQILNHLISNALKFTPEGTIEIGFTLIAGNTIVFHVNDTGIGIPQEQQQMVFERFRRLENGMLRTFTGAGLGLNISQGLAALFNSTITIKSQPEEGSLFRFSIPYVAYEAPQMIQQTELNGSTMHNWSGKTALLVEADPVNAHFLTVLLLKTNIGLLYASDGKEAIELVKSSPVDIVLMDMNLPVIDGYEATRQIKQLRPELPIIAQTAHALSEDKIHCIEAGCDEYMAKPICKRKLYAMMAGFLSPDVSINPDQQHTIQPMKLSFP